ncbi:Uncharacterized protein DAT39_011595, partial [Clarias magur]
MDEIMDCSWTRKQREERERVISNSHRLCRSFRREKEEREAHRGRVNEELTEDLKEDKRIGKLKKDLWR